MPRTHSQDWGIGDAITAARLQDINEDLDDLYILGNDRGRIIQGAGALEIDIGAFSWFVGSLQGVKAAQVGVAVTDNATNYVEIDDTGTIQINTSGWTTAYARLGNVVTSGGVITDIVIYRPDIIGGELGGASLPYNSVSSKSASTVYQASNKGGFLVVTGTAAASGNDTESTIFSDSSATPTTVIARSRVNGGVTNNAVHLATPILPNDYYEWTTVNSQMVGHFYENI